MLVERAIGMIEALQGCLARVERLVFPSPGLVRKRRLIEWDGLVGAGNREVAVLEFDVARVLLKRGLRAMVVGTIVGILSFSR